MNKIKQIIVSYLARNTGLWHANEDKIDELVKEILRQYMGRTLTKKGAEKKALKAMSDYIRTRDKYICCTCGKRGDKYTIDSGHFLTRRYKAIKYDERNVNAQCIKCNQYGGGMWDLYYEYMLGRYGQEVVDELQSKKNILIKRSISDFLEIEKYYKQKLENINCN